MVARLEKGPASAFLAQSSTMLPFMPLEAGTPIPTFITLLPDKKLVGQRIIRFKREGDYLGKPL
jgi:hypothetical protein